MSSGATLASFAGPYRLRSHARSRTNLGPHPPLLARRYSRRVRRNSSFRNASAYVDDGTPYAGPQRAAKSRISFKDEVGGEVEEVSAAAAALQRGIGARSRAVVAAAAATVAMAAKQACLAPRAASPLR